eukprot:CAMPEP_0176468870 /NCGR_PEP_ID=MMETSP0127-20121128/39403_1 /TAXON_ID=938130 /ORGANISM="Platyophrya macrostoma, Strain WH" /LENGTH=512 /DNA_ID=CAMNT_0017862627 /DNA_START=129 /DNA_END=1667 /DNA_ORIENTATION=-
MSGGGPLLMATTPATSSYHHHLSHDMMGGNGGVDEGWGSSNGVHQPPTGGMRNQSMGGSMYWQQQQLQQQSVSDFSSPEDSATVSQPPSRTDSRVVCKYFASGGCDRGESCPFSHDLTVNATNATEATCGFVLTGQVVNLRHPQRSGSGGKGEEHEGRVLGSPSSPTPSMMLHDLMQHHSMNPSAIPFVSSSGAGGGVVDMADVMGYAAQNGGNSRMTFNGTFNTHDGNGVPLSMVGVGGYHSSAGGAEDAALLHQMGSPEEADMYAAYQHQQQQHMLMPSQHHSHHYGGGPMVESGSSNGGMFLPHEATSMMTDRVGDWGGDPTASPGGYYGTNNGEYGTMDGGMEYGTSSSNAGWRPSGVFNAPDGLRGYEEYQSSLVMAGRTREAWYHHRRMQAMRPPLGGVPAVGAAGGQLTPLQPSNAQQPTPSPTSATTVGMSFTPYAAATSRSSLIPAAGGTSGVIKSNLPGGFESTKVQLTPYGPSSTMASGRQSNGVAASWTSADVHRSLRNR